MKLYTKPTLEVIELSVKENIAYVPGTFDGDGITGVSGSVESGTVVTQYALGTYGVILASD